VAHAADVQGVEDARAAVVAGVGFRIHSFGGGGGDGFGGCGGRL